MKIYSYHSCYDEMLSSLFLTPKNLKSKDVKTRTVELYSKATDTKGNNFLNFNVSMTAHEILVYSLLLHKCIENSVENSTISYKELQLLRNKRCGRNVVIDSDTLKAYNNAFKGLCNKYIKYYYENKSKKSKITYYKGEHPLLLISKVDNLNNNDKVINYSLGPFGKMLLEKRRYSTLLPNKYFQINFNEIMTYESALYICRIIYMERRKKKDYITITLNSIMKNTNKYVIKNKELIKVGTCLEYDGHNIKRLWNLVMNNVNEILNQLKIEFVIKDYMIQDLNSNREYKNIRWKVSLDK